MTAQRPAVHAEVLGQALLAENPMSAEGMRYLQAVVEGHG